MSERSDISGLQCFIGRDEVWPDRLQATVGEHLLHALEETDLDHDNLAEPLDEQWSGVLWGCGFEVRWTIATAAAISSIFGAHFGRWINAFEQCRRLAEKLDTHGRRPARG